jgi:hypothetical protein
MPKRGHSDNENEDNFSLPERPGMKKVIHFAISDGATESSFSKEWSSLLVSEYNINPFGKNNLRETLSKLSQKWHSKIDEKELPWYAQQKAEMGAFATFLGLKIEKERQCFDVIAIGDCCLFLIRGDNLLFSFPASSLKDFSNTPNLLASNLKYQEDLNNIVHDHFSEALCPNDILLLATDAIAAWIFKQIEDNKKPWHILDKALSKNIFEKWLDSERSGNKMKNDDVTLLIIKIRQ